MRSPTRSERTLQRLVTRPPVFLALLPSLVFGCGGKPPPPEEAPDAGPAFIADQGDFADFTNWESFDGGTEAFDNLAVGTQPLVAQRELFLNQRPPHGSTQFPLGTIIVKTTQGAPTFAMARRGGGFNPQGAGWEWFELTGAGDGGVEISWRGDGTGGMLAYGTTAATGCDSCHFQAIENDYVAGTAIQLSSF